MTGISAFEIRFYSVGSRISPVWGLTHHRQVPRLHSPNPLQGLLGTSQKVFT